MKSHLGVVRASPQGVKPKEPDLPSLNEAGVCPQERVMLWSSTRGRNSSSPWPQTVIYLLVRSYFIICGFSQEDNIAASLLSSKKWEHEQRKRKTSERVWNSSILRILYMYYLLNNVHVSNWCDFSVWIQISHWKTCSVSHQVKIKSHKKISKCVHSFLSNI